jgi:hypothetical protein
MSFTFDPALTDEVSQVRFHIGDTSENDHYIEDGTIKYLLTAGSIGTAVIRCIQYIITRLSVPDERVGQYSITHAGALAGYQDLLKIKAQEFNISLSGAVASSSISLPYRADSYMTSGDQDGKP